MPTKPSLIRRLLRAFIAAVVVINLATVTVLLPLRWINPPTSAFMLADNSGRDPVLFDWQDIDVIDESALLAVVSAEDQLFADHFGMDFSSIRSAIDEHSTSGKLRGASTISQQTVKNLFLWNSRSYVRKAIEAYLTLAIELLLSKRRILEIYINIVELGPGIYGFNAASEFYFGKTADQLTDAESALLASSLPNPKRYRVDQPGPYMQERQRWVITEMARLRREGWLNRLD